MQNKYILLPFYFRYINNVNKYILSNINGDYCIIDNISIPNVFTPNGDQNNDVFKITLNDNLITKEGELTMFNRWGNKILHSNKKMSWDGKNNPSGVYYYIFRYKGETYKGHVSLFK